MKEKAEQISNELKEKARRYELLSDLLKKAVDVEMFLDELTSEVGDRCGWMTEKAWEIREEIETEMAEIEAVLV